MTKITVTTWYEIIVPDGEQRMLKAETESLYHSAEMLRGVFDGHMAKMGAIERKILKENE